MTKTLAETLPSIIAKKGKRLGRGHGSGKVKTSGRGTKGQNARGTMKPGFEGGQLPLIKRLPLLRGKGKNQRVKPKAFPVRVGDIGSIPVKEEVTVEILRKHDIISDKVMSVKLLSGGEIKGAYTVHVPCSRTARIQIEKAGGRVEVKE